MKLSLLHRIKEIQHEINLLDDSEYHKDRLRELHTDLFFICASKKQKLRLYEDLRVDMPTKDVDAMFEIAESRIANMR